MSFGGSLLHPTLKYNQTNSIDNHAITSSNNRSPALTALHSNPSNKPLRAVQPSPPPTRHQSLSTPQQQPLVTSFVAARADSSCSPARLRSFSSCFSQYYYSGSRDAAPPHGRGTSATTRTSNPAHAPSRRLVRSNMCLYLRAYTQQAAPDEHEICTEFDRSALPRALLLSRGAPERAERALRSGRRAAGRGSARRARKHCTQWGACARELSPRVHACPSRLNSMQVGARFYVRPYVCGCVFVVFQCNFGRKPMNRG